MPAAVMRLAPRHAKRKKIPALLALNNSGTRVGQALLDGAPFYSDLFNTAVPQRAASGVTGSFTRATTKTWKNNDGYLVTGLAGEIDFPGARRVRNLLTFTEDLTNAAWVTSSATATNGVTDPLGTTRAATITATANGGLVYQAVSPPAATGYVAVNSVYIRRRTGSGNIYFRTANNVDVDVTSSVTTSWTRIYSAPDAPSAGTWYFVLRFATNGDAVDIAFPQMEDVTAQTTQTAGEYVSVGVVQRNILTYTEEFNNAAWSTSNITVTANAVAAPNNTVTADLLTNNNTSAVLDRSTTITANASVGYSIYLKYSNHVWARILIGGSGNQFQLYVNLQTGTIGTASALGTATLTSTAIESVGNGFYRISAVGSLGGGITSVQHRIWLVDADNGSTVVSAAAAYYWGAQLEIGSSITDYQAVGGSYLYHGSFVDGVKCFNTDLDGNALPTEYTYDAVSLNGVAGTYVSTPDSVASSITGDIAAIVKLAMVDWTPSTLQEVIAKDDAGTQRSWQLNIAAGGIVWLYWWDASGTIQQKNCGVGTGFTDGSEGYLAFALDVNDGANNSVLKFFKSSDGITFTQLGSTVTTAGGLSVKDTTAAIELGSNGSGVNALAGKIYQAKVYNGIPTILSGAGGTLAVDFDASRYEGGSTLTGSTGETWTLNGNAIIHPTNNPMLRYKPESAATNLCLQSQTLSVSGAGGWSTFNASVVADAVAAPDGTITAEKITESAVSAQHLIYTTTPMTVAANTTYTISLFVKSAERTRGRIQWEIGGAVDGCYADFNLSTGTISGGVFGGGTYTASYIEPVGSAGWYRISLVGKLNAASTAGYFDIITADASGSTTYLGVVNSGFYAWGAQVELGSFASSYIATTTAAVTRNADILTYSGGDVANFKTLMAGFRREVGVSSVGVPAALTDGTANDNATFYLDSATGIAYTVADGGAVQAQAYLSPAYTAGANYKAVISVASNDFKIAAQGMAQTPDTTGTTPTTTQINVGHQAGNYNLNGNVGPVAAWTRNLSQSELNAVTA